MLSQAKRAERQLQLLVEWVNDGWFYDCLGSYDFPDFQLTTVNVIDYRLGYVNMKVTEISIPQEAWENECICPSELMETRWLNIQCAWDPEELDKAGSAHKSDTLNVDIGDEIEFGSMSLDEAKKIDSLNDLLVDIISDKIIDHCHHELENVSAVPSRLISRQPAFLRGLIKSACDTKLKKLRTGRSGLARSL